MAKPVKIAHILFMTRQFEEMIQWYQSVFEAEVVQQTPALSFLAFDDENHRFGIANLSVLKETSPTAAAMGEIGINHVAFTYASIGDLLETHARLNEADIHPYWAIHHGMTVSLYYLDPNRNRMELQVDSCSTKEAIEYMTSEAFAANPVGVDIAPDQLLAQFRAGVSAEELLAMPDGPMSAIPVEHGVT
ncbi:VOC family protein [Thalassotalea mangrovi]|uniref:Biphenyl 2,3-dioxygenase n=1 Tax=Thalassotalea mangrovi TaxID=2572245 RepID=A0A4U1B704_9GAMM|nr:VOC family protein [Thalassotalea mangrovi]TKB45967.1 biphenyl 2,3-dioxygenase [Thalassotalea mangrovi]